MITEGILIIQNILLNKINNLIIVEDRNIINEEIIIITHKNKQTVDLMDSLEIHSMNNNIATRIGVKVNKRI